jgi:hypothetical protein
MNVRSLKLPFYQNRFISRITNLPFREICPSHICNLSKRPFWSSCVFSHLCLVPLPCFLPYSASEPVNVSPLFIYFTAETSFCPVVSFILLSWRLYTTHCSLWLILPPPSFQFKGLRPSIALIPIGSLRGPLLAAIFPICIGFLISFQDKDKELRRKTDLNLCRRRYQAKTK